MISLCWAEDIKVRRQHASQQPARNERCKSLGCLQTVRGESVTAVAAAFAVPLAVLQTS